MNPQSAIRNPQSPTLVAIVGVGCLFPKAGGAGDYWAAVKSGADCITDVPPTHWNPADYFDPDPKSPDMTYARRGGFLSPVPFNPLEFGIAPRDLEATDTTQLLGLVAAKMALQDAGVVFADEAQSQASGPGNRAGADPHQLPVSAVDDTAGGGQHRPAYAGRSPGGRSPVRRDRVSVILGVTGTLELVIPLGARLGHPKWKRAMKDAGVPDDAIADAAARIADEYVPWQENSFPGLLGNVVAGRIANKLDLHGTNCVVDAACASSLSAVHLAALELSAGRSDVVVTGGADTFNDIFMYMCFSKTPALSPTGDAKPFDAAGDGTILGEGIGVVVLKRLADAERDGDTVYAVLKAVGSSSDGKGNAIYAPSAAGQKRALRTAYGLAGVTPDTIELVEAHGTGTRVGDGVEVAALTEVFDADAAAGAAPKPRPWCAVGSVKSQIGHTKAAAGAASLIKVALALYHKVLPPTAKVTRPLDPLLAPDCPFYVNTAARPWLPRADHPRRAALSAFGFGGSNFHAVLEEHAPAKARPDWDGSVELWAASGDTPQAVRERLDALVGWDGGFAQSHGLSGAKTFPTTAGPYSATQPAQSQGVSGAKTWDSAEPPSHPTKAWAAFARAAEASRAAFDPAAPCRLVLVAHRVATDLPKLLANARAKLAADPGSAGWHTPDGAFYGRGPAAGGVGLLFPGQGSQAVGMLRDLSCLFPEMLDSLAAADAAFAEQTPDASDGRRLSDRIYPPPAFDPDAARRQDAALRATDVAQPALGAVSFGAFRVLRERFGLAPAAVAGHSYGELVALAAAGRLTPDELFRLSRLRGRLMAEQRPGDPGAMLAVFASAADASAVAREVGGGLVLANKNAPAQTVLSGPTADVEAAVKRFAAAGVRAVRLAVAAAFHSPLVADAAEPFRAALDGVPLPPAELPVFANTTAAPYPADPAAARDLLGRQLALPVAFADEVRAMYAAGVRTFVEVGPGTVLARLADATLADVGAADAAVIPLDGSSGKRPGVLDLGYTLGRLAARGHAVRLSEWEAGSRCRPAPEPKPGLTVPVCGANAVSPRPKRPARPPLAAAAPPPPTHPAGAPAMSDPVPGPAPAHDPAGLAPALAVTHQTLTALQRMQEQTAQLHRQFLETQEQAQRTLFALVAQQQGLLFPGGLPGAVAPPPAAAPAPTYPPPPAAVVPPPAAVVPPVPAHAPAAPPPAAVVAPPAAVVTPAVPPPPVAPPVPSANGAPAGPAAVMATLLAVVAEKTGYPAEMLDPGMALDADLGVDSIKRVEILSALQERLPHAPQVKPEHLAALHTLRDVAAFLADGEGAGEPAEPPALSADGESIDLLTAPAPTPPPAPAAAPAHPDGGVSFELPPGQPTDSIAFPLSAAEMTALAAGPGRDEVERVLLAVVAEKTGYPTEMLDPGMALDADLGVDSIKRVEILSALQERLPHAPQVKPEHLAALHTLRDVAAFLADAQEFAPSTSKVSLAELEAGLQANQPGGPFTQRVAPPAPRQTPPPPPAADTVRPPAPPPSPERVDRSVVQAVDLDPPAARPRLPLDGGEVWLVTADDPLGKQLAAQLEKRGFTPKTWAWADPDIVKPAGDPVGLVLLPPARVPAVLPVNRIGFRWLQAAGPKLRQQAKRGGAAVFATVVRLDGCFGLGDLRADADPTAGGLGGLAKTARHEWPEVASKAIDLAPGFAADRPADAAAAVADELLAVGPAEVGVSASHFCTLELARAITRPAPPGAAVLGPKDVVLVTGGGRGVTAEVAVAIAEAYRPTLVLTGRTPAPAGPEPDWLRGAADEPAMKKAIADHLGAAATPKAVGEFFARVSAQREIARTLARIEAAGAKAAYIPANIAVGRQAADVVHQAQVKFGPVTALVHGAGVLADKRIEDLTADQFDAVYATKVDGLRHLLDLLGRQELKAVLLFSSTTGRLGRVGQLAYAAANEVLNKVAQVEARKRPGCRVVAVNWGPWEGGMVTPGLRKVFEAEGVGLIPLADGGAFAAHELAAGGRAVEVVALGKPTRPAKPGSGAMPRSGATRTPVPPLPGLGASPTPPRPLPQPPSAPPPPAELLPAFERTLDVATHSVLRSHVLDGRAVLPMALHLEWLAHAALHGNPGLVFHGMNELRITHGVMVEDGTAAALKALAGRAVKHDKFFHVPVELRGKRRDGREVVHSRAEVVLAAALPKPPAADKLPDVQPYPHPVDEVYRYFLFHGPELHGIEKVDGLTETAFVATAYPAPPPAEWFQTPLRSGWLADPLVIDASFQMMILWSFAQHGAGSLPCFAGRYRQYRRSFPAGPVKVVIRVTRDNGSFARADIDFRDADGLVVAQMQDYECVIDRQLDQAFRRNQLAPKVRQ